MKDILLEANGLVVDWANSSPKRNKPWKEKRDTLNESWEEVRVQLLESLLKTKFGIDHDKLKCKRCQEKAVVRCEECHPHKYLCGNCDVEIHQDHPFHDRDAVVNGRFQPISSSVSKNNKNDWITIGK